MFKNIKKTFSLCLLIIFAGILLTSCELPTPGPGGTNVGGITEKDLEALVFEDITVEYTGEPHSILIDNIYEDKGVKINYFNNGKTEPGTYTVNAIIRYNDISVNKSAVLKIEKCASVMTADEVQTLNLASDEFDLKFTVDNGLVNNLQILDENGQVITLRQIKKPGVYNLELYVRGNYYYQDSNHVKVTVNVIESAFDISFDSKKVIADGAEHKVELTGTLPEGYTVEHSNNVGTVDGTYLAVAQIRNEAGEVVEKHNAVLVIENPEHEEFQKYLDEFFVSYLEGDQLSVNIFCENPVDFGLEHYEASWYTFEAFEEGAIEHDLQLFKDMLVELEQFKDAPLNDLQDSAYETVRKFIQYYIDYYSIEDAFYMDIVYVDQFGGYVADFGTYMEAYSLRSELEVQDIVDYIESTKTAFPSYLGFLQVKAEQGYPLSDFTITEMMKYLEDVLAQGADYYLKDILIEKIEAVDFLSEEQKDSYQSQIATAIAESFIVGVQGLYDGLDEFLGLLPEEEEGYLATYENGQAIYMEQLQRLLGYEDLVAEDYIKEVETELKASVRKVISTQQTIVQLFNVSTYAELEAAIAQYPIFKGEAGALPTPEQQVEFLKEFAKTIVPDLQSNPNIVVKEMDIASAKVSNAVAYYMKSALDNTGSEYITLNPVKTKVSSQNDVLGTLAHEGYPGHLYAYIYSKELELSNLATVMTNTGHAEGWATYVQLKLYEYAKEQSDDEKFDAVMDYLYANELSSFLLETRLDAGIHLEGWTAEDIATYMTNLGYSGDSAESIYDLLVEIPTQYASYGYGKYIFIKLHSEAQKKLGIYYDEVEFNAMLLSKGWTDLEQLEKTYEDYMTIKCHEHGIAFN